MRTIKRGAASRPPRKPIRTRAAIPPRPPIRSNPIIPPGVLRGAPTRPGPSPEQVGEDFVVPQMPEYHPHMPARPQMPQRPRWEGVMPEGGVAGALGGGEQKFDMSQDIMDALMELLMQRMGGPGGRAY